MRCNYVEHHYFYLNFRLCGADCSVETSPATWCTHLTIIELPCGHEKKVKCFETKLNINQHCHAKCEAILDCEHVCQGIGLFGHLKSTLIFNIAGETKGQSQA